MIIMNQSDRIRMIGISKLDDTETYYFTNNKLFQYSTQGDKRIKLTFIDRIKLIKHLNTLEAMEKRKESFGKYLMNSTAKWAIVCCIFFTTLSVVQQLIRGTGEWYFGLFFLLPAIIAVFGTWMNYKKYWV